MFTVVKNRQFTLDFVFWCLTIWISYLFIYLKNNASSSLLIITNGRAFYSFVWQIQLKSTLSNFCPIQVIFPFDGIIPWKLFWTTVFIPCLFKLDKRQHMSCKTVYWRLHLTFVKINQRFHAFYLLFYLFIHISLYFGLELMNSLSNLSMLRFLSPHSQCIQIFFGLVLLRFVFRCITIHLLQFQLPSAFFPQFYHNAF